MPMQLPDILPDILSGLIAGLIIAALTYAVVFGARWLAGRIGQERLERWLLSLAWPILASVFFSASLLFAFNLRYSLTWPRCPGKAFTYCFPRVGIKPIPVADNVVDS